MIKTVYAIEYHDINFEEVKDDLWDWVRCKRHVEYFDDEFEFNKKVTELEDGYDDYEITGVYVGDFRKITR